MAQGSIHWSELVSADVEASKKFFSQIAGWTITEMPMPNGAYNICMVDGAPVAGIMGIEQIQADHDIQRVRRARQNQSQPCCVKLLDCSLSTKTNAVRAGTNGLLLVPAGIKKLHQTARFTEVVGRQ